MSKTLAPFLALVLASLCACASDTTAEDDTASIAGDLTDSATLEASLIAAMDPGSAETTEEAAEAATQSLRELFDACFTVATEGRTTTYTFDACEGAWGLVGVDGVVTTRWTPGVGFLRYEIATTGLMVGGASLDFGAEVTVRQDGDRTIFEVASSSASVGPRGRTTESRGEYVVVRDGADCVEIDGAWSGEGRTPWSMTVDGYRHCAGTCPVSGTVSRGRLTLVFDGDATASWALGDRAGELPLFCE